MKKSSSPADMHVAAAPRRSTASSSQAAGHCRDGQCPVKRPFLALVRKYGVPVAITVLPSIGGALASHCLRREYRHWYENLRKPSWCPRHWVFLPMFNLCYPTMGFASYMVYAEEGCRTALKLYGVQLALSWLWVPLLFKQRMMALAFVDSALLVGFSAATLWAFRPVSVGATLVFLPSFLWSVYLMLTSYFVWKRNSIVLKNG